MSRGPLTVRRMRTGLRARAPMAGLTVVRLRARPVVEAGVRGRSLKVGLVIVGVR